MPFAPVKSDPWRKKRRRRVKWPHLWTEEEWKRIVDMAHVGEAIIAIREANARVARDTAERRFGW